jgi:hypothetical protein
VRQGHRSTAHKQRDPLPGTEILKFRVGGQEFYVDDVCFDC